MRSIKKKCVSDVSGQTCVREGWEAITRQICACHWLLLVVDEHAGCLLKAPSSSGSLPWYQPAEEEDGQITTALTHSGLCGHGGPQPQRLVWVYRWCWVVGSLRRKKGGPPASSPLWGLQEQAGNCSQTHWHLSVQDMPAFVWWTEACKNATWSFPEWYLLLERSSAVGHTSY